MTQLEIWLISSYEEKNFKGSFSKNILTPRQVMRCSLGSVLQFLRCCLKKKKKLVFVTQCSVLTAGHCMPENHPLNFIRVYLGRHIRTSGGTKYGVQKATFHPGYKDFLAGKSKEYHPFDLLLLRLDRKVTFSNTISPVCLPNGPEDRDGNLCNSSIIFVRFHDWVFTELAQPSRFSHRVAMSVSLFVCLSVCLRHRVHFF